MGGGKEGRGKEGRKGRKRRKRREEEGKEEKGSGEKGENEGNPIASCKVCALIIFDLKFITYSPVNLTQARLSCSSSIQHASINVAFMII